MKYRVEDIKKILTQNENTSQSQILALLEGLSDEETDDVLCFLQKCRISVIDDMETITDLEEDEELHLSFADFLSDLHLDEEEMNEAVKINEFRKRYDNVELYYRDIEREEEKIRQSHRIQENCQKNQTEDGESPSGK